jgi:lipid A 3-O-deacylase
MRTTLVLAILLTGSGMAAYGGTEMAPTPEKTVVAEVTPFDKGKLELQSSSGAYWSVDPGGRPTINNWSSSYRLGIMLNTPEGDGFFRGNCELMVQALYGSVFDGPGNWLGGAGLIFRYNFVQPGARWVPYVQVGAGVVANDIYKDQSQKLIGQQWEFELEAAVGIRLFLTDRCSVALEGGYRHISNAGMNDRNIGLNSLGVTAGLGLHF